jgi:hypothetical protein
VLMLGWSTGILVTVIGVIYGRLFPSLKTHVRWSVGGRE